MDADSQGKQWAPVPLPTMLRGLQDLCKWLNYMDGVLTAYNLTSGVYTEWNPIMRKAWETSPVVYATMKWWMFWLGLQLLEKSILLDAVEENKDTQKLLLRWVLGTFAMIIAWHIWLIFNYTS